MKLKNPKRIIKCDKKFGFTLIEMLLVIVIISMVLGMTIYLGSENIFKLKYRTAKEEFLSTFNLFYTNSLESNYINKNRFDKLNLNLFSGDNGIIYSYIGESHNRTGEKKIDLIQISDIKIDSGTIQNQVSIETIPYQLGCKIKYNNNQTGSRLDFKIIINKTKTYCLYIISENCKIKENICSN